MICISWDSVEKLAKKLFQASLDCIFMAFATLTLTVVRRSRLPALLFGKKLDFFKWEPELPQLARSRTLQPRSRWSVMGWKVFHMLSPSDRDETFFDKTASLSKHSGRNGIIFVWYVFYVKLKQSTKPYNSRKRYKFMFHHFGQFSSWIGSRSTGLKFPKWTDYNIRPGNPGSPVTGLIWRGPKHQLANADVFPAVTGSIKKPVTAGNMSAFARYQ